MNGQKVVDVVHFNNGTGGGVLSVISNLIRFSENPLIRNHVIFAINKKQFPEFTVPQVEGAACVQVFRFSPNWNFYYTCRQLAKLLPGDNAVIVAHDWLELGMASTLGLQNPVVYFLHGDYDYYYDLAKTHDASIDQYITVAESIKARLFREISGRKSDIHYLRFPVGNALPRTDSNFNFQLLFIGRLTKGKGFDVLPLIEEELRKKSIKVDWHIVGEDVDGIKETVEWPTAASVTFHGSLANEKVKEMLVSMDVIVLPSSFEGMPVTLVEGMKAGVIPLVNDIDGGVQELVADKETGFKIKLNRPALYAESIQSLKDDENLCRQMRNHCMAKAGEMFDPFKNTREIEKVIEAASGIKKKKMAVKNAGSRLDKKWMPNLITKAMRKVRN